MPQKNTRQIGTVKAGPTVTETVREIALNQPTSIRVFEELGIDYCCGGRKPLAMACAENDLEIDAVLAALASAAAQSGAELEDWSKAPLISLCDHILLQHHEYVKRELPRLAALAEKVVGKHGSHHAELAGIEAALQTLDMELMQHMAKEEMVLFPYIAKLEQALQNGGAPPQSCFGAVANPIAMMSREHDGAGELLAEMRRLSNGFTLPADACPTYHAFFNGLKEFEQDLHQHIHLENNILFPRAIEMEASYLR